MTQITSLSPKQLRTAADLQEKILALQSQLNELLGAPAAEAPVAASGPGKTRRKLSPQAIANIRAGVVKRMAKKAKEAAAAPADAAPKKRSAAWRKALSASLKARWAARKAAGQSKL